MTSLHDRVHEARLKGFSDEEIYNTLEKSPKYKEKISKAESEGFSIDEIKNTIFPKKRIGKAASIGAGAIEGAMMPLVLSQFAGEKLSPAQPENLVLQRDIDARILEKPFNQMSFADIHALGEDVVAPGDFFGPKASQRQQLQQSEYGNTPMDALMRLPESEDSSARKLRAGASGGTAGALFGPMGALMGSVGGYAGQAVREDVGKNGKTENWWQEGKAIAADILAGMGTNLLTTATKNITKKTAENIAGRIFSQPETALEKSLVKNTVQDARALEAHVASIGESELRDFERAISEITPGNFENLPLANTEPLKDRMLTSFRNQNLRIISPVESTAEVGGIALREEATNVFNQSVKRGEANAYNTAREAATGLSGQAPQTVNMAKELLQEIVAVTPNAEQNPVVSYLRGLIRDLESNVPKQIIPASKLLDSSGRSITGQQIIPASTNARSVAANDLVKLVQNGNHAVNYESAYREQSHRLKPIIAKLREETASVLARNPEARLAYQEANNLHARNAEIWGTKYMRNVLYGENPASIVSQSKKAANLRNFKQAVPNLEYQNQLDRLVIEDITRSGQHATNLNTMNELGSALSPNAQEAGRNIINIKNPASVAGGINAAANDIVKEVSESIINGVRPTNTLNIMKTRKGYNFVRNTLSSTPEGRRIFETLRKTFVQDVFDGILDKSGRIDFNKANNIFKNPEIRGVIEEIGGPQLVSRFERLEGMATNFQRNVNFYKKPETKSLFKSIIGASGKAGLISYMLHTLRMPTPMIAALGLTMLVGKGATIVGKRLWKEMIQNPKIFNALEDVSRASTEKALRTQLPRLIYEIEKFEKENPDKENLDK